MRGLCSDTPKSVHSDRFWQNCMHGPRDQLLLSKPVPRTDFGCQNWSPLAKISPPGGPNLAKVSAKIGPPFTNLSAHACYMHIHLDACTFRSYTVIASYSPLMHASLYMYIHSYSYSYDHRYLTPGLETVM